MKTGKEKLKMSVLTTLKVNTIQYLDLDQLRCEVLIRKSITVDGSKVITPPLRGDGA